MSLYNNSKLRTVSIKGDTISDRAIEMWNEMNWQQRYEISTKVKDFKNGIIKQRACINYIAEFMIEGGE